LDGLVKKKTAAFFEREVVERTISRCNVALRQQTAGAAAYQVLSAAEMPVPDGAGKSFFWSST
jgi:hypothetical protein